MNAPHDRWARAREGRKLRNTEGVVVLLASCSVLRKLLCRFRRVPWFPSRGAVCVDFRISRVGVPFVRARSL